MTSHHTRPRPLSANQLVALQTYASGSGARVHARVHSSTTRSLHERGLIEPLGAGCWAVTAAGRVAFEAQNPFRASDGPVGAPEPPAPSSSSPATPKGAEAFMSALSAFQGDDERAAFEQSLTAQVTPVGGPGPADRPRRHGHARTRTAKHRDRRHRRTR